jgi:2-oxoisovalerate dehydrogenase E2 component (dihydrolipoyl transacylase)
MGLVAVKMPQLGESVTEGTVERWLKKEGDSVARDEPLVEVVTDKVNAEIPSPFDGKLARIEVAEGQTVAIGATIAQMEVEELESAGSDGSPSREAVPTSRPVASDEAVRVNPAIRLLAEERGVDLSAITGTGAGGRITRGDVLSHSAGTRPAVASEHAATQPARSTTPVGPREELMRVSAVRRQIAENMVRSVTNIPHAWGMREVDMTALVRYREERKVDFQQRYGISLSYLPFVIQVVCDALKANPLLNSTWRDDGILIKHYINLGIAIALPDAVIVPVIKDADQLGLAQLAHAVSDLTTRARDRKLVAADVQGGTFTLNNVGAIGGFASMSIINHPQAAILTTQSIVRRPVGRDEQIVLRDMMNLTMSFDHRILDGVLASKFLTAVQGSLENWTPEMIRN